MKLIFQINDYKLRGGAAGLGTTLGEMAQAAEENGFESIVVQDHVWQSSYMGGFEGPMLECYSTLAYLAARTTRCRLFALATAVSYREPAMLAKMVTTLNVLSGGRGGLGIGVGDFEEEAVGMGLPYSSLSTRYEMLEETLQICRHLWHGDEQPFHGNHYTLERPLNCPQSLSRPHPPILIAGSGEQKTLRLVAKYGDACNIRPGPEIPRKLDALRRHCDDIGRDYDEIEKTCAFLFDIGSQGEKTGQLIAQLRGFSEMGIQTVVGRVVDADRITPIEIMGREVIPAIADF
ncbi:MAG TPA: TIGR03560 family F420-dependent LLM class oxidoreductase [Thermomicrobiales bacterium]|nr:TIGR03560 family F420-dependent LLM class oxidoreductase [Thermomicrobiales bacterium]